MRRMGNKALITDVTGQDGSSLAESLWAKGFDVHEIIVRWMSCFNLARIDHLCQNSEICGKTFLLHYGA